MGSDCTELCLFPLGHHGDLSVTIHVDLSYPFCDCSGFHFVGAPLLQTLSVNTLDVHTSLHPAIYAGSIPSDRISRPKETHLKW